MALITCPECGRMISTKADFCPQCGWKPSLLYCNKANAIPREPIQDNSIAANNSNNTGYNIQPAQPHNQHVAPTASDNMPQNIQPAESYNYNQPEEPTASDYTSQNLQQAESYNYNQPEEPTASDYTDDNNEDNVTISMSNGKRFKINTNALLKAAIAILAVIALIAILKNCTRNNHNNSTNNNTPNEVVTTETETSKGWEYEQDMNGKVIASIMADNAPVTMTLINDGSQILNTATAVATKMYGLKDNNSIGVSINGVTYMCEAKRDEEAGSPTYLITLKNGLIDKFKTFSNFSLIFDNEEVTFSSSKALDMPSPEPIQQLPITETTPAPSPKPSTQPKPQAKPQPKPQQESARESSEQHSQARTDQPSRTPTIDIEDEEEQTVDKVFADPKRIKNYPKPPMHHEETKTRETTRPVPVNQLPPNVREKLIQQRGNDDDEE